jgi:hypothetical protein
MKVGRLLAHESFNLALVVGGGGSVGMCLCVKLERRCSLFCPLKVTTHSLTYSLTHCHCLPRALLL